MTGPQGYGSAGSQQDQNFEATQIAATDYRTEQAGGQVPHFGSPANAPQFGAASQAEGPAHNPYAHSSAPTQASVAGVSKTRSSAFTVAVVVVGVAAAVFLVTAFWKPGFLANSGGSTMLDSAKAADGVTKVVTDSTTGYAVKDVKDVKCNDGKNVQVKKDTAFTCDMTIAGVKRQITATFQDDNGAFEVGPPQ